MLNISPRSLIFGALPLVLSGWTGCGNSVPADLFGAASAGPGGAAGMSSGGSAGVVISAGAGGVVSAGAGGLNSGGRGSSGGDATPAGGVGIGGSEPGNVADGDGGASTMATVPSLHTDGARFKDASGNVVVLRGLDTADLAVLDTQRTPMNISKLLDLMSDATQGWYARAVRLAVSPSAWNRNPDDYFKRYLMPAVEHATARNLYAIIDWHYVADPAPNAASTIAFWAYVAPKFATQQNVIFELYNEPIKINGSVKWADWKALAQPWVDGIRGVAPDNVVLIGGPQWSQNIGGAATDPFIGKNLAYVGHVYPQVSKALWKPGGEIALAAATRPVIITEWGYIQGGAQPTSGTQTSFGDPFKVWLEQSGVSWTAWCADNSWDPKMFDATWTLLGGDNYMGTFIKAYLAEKKAENHPH